MIIDAYNTTQDVRGRSDYLTGAKPGQAPPPYTPFDPKRILDRMDAAGVDMAMVCSLAQRIENDFIAGLVKAHPDRFIGFGQVMPQADDALDEIARMKDMGISGLKLHPSMHGYHVADHGLLDPVFEKCAELGMPILINALDDAFCAPLAIEEIAKGHPTVPTIIAHMGAVWNVPEAIIVAERNPHIYLETSATLIADVRRAYARLGPNQILFGSEWPGSDFDLERMKIAKAVPDEADRALVEGGNMARILGL
ncbi:amidohydrolase family protein [Actinoplanes couchii]|uniref:Metal-dependent hydrolase n=1 Tax=Actinoplanes couchii TaxID=403638 RepID=A0ABQ3XG48_9ACTN|nr:amidohydrolase family protein [Actinoplanes couchii]MDR6320967.1 putative TIM-barrel fold metal-dependent hydrolase [Actinoplanes couchii]GID57479.1 metal-dependent hydrolase [Actinoplanes couchii]